MFVADRMVVAIEKQKKHSRRLVTKHVIKKQQQPFKQNVMGFPKPIPICYVAVWFRKKATLKFLNILFNFFYIFYLLLSFMNILLGMGTIVITDAIEH